MDMLTNLENFDNLPFKICDKKLCTKSIIYSEKNRYSNVFAPDETLVKLKKCEYINANYVDVGNKKVIASQGPIENTISDFWNMIMEEKSPLVIMLTNFIENGVSKCSRYFPKKGKASYDDIKITRTNILKKNGYEISDILIESNLGSHQTKHLHFKSWKDASIPDKDVLIESLLEIDWYLESPHHIVCHCSAGIGRTGVLLTIIRCLRTNETPQTVISLLRKDRHGLVQNKEQYKFILDFLNI